MPLKGVLWNARGWISKEAEMKKRCGSWDIGLITELKNKRDSQFNLPGFEVVTENRYKSGRGGAGGVAIFTRRGIKRKLLNFPQNANDFDVRSANSGR